MQHQSGDQLVRQLSHHIRVRELPKTSRHDNQQQVYSSSVHQSSPLSFTMDPRHLQYLNWRFNQLPFSPQKPDDSSATPPSADISPATNHSARDLKSQRGSRDQMIRSLSALSLASSRHPVEFAALTIDQDLLLIHRFLGLVEHLRLVPAAKRYLNDPAMEGQQLMVDLECFHSLTRLSLIQVSPDCVTGLIPRVNMVTELICRGVELNAACRLLINPVVEDQRRRKGKQTIGSSSDLAPVEGDRHSGKWEAEESVNAIVAKWSGLKSLNLSMNSLSEFDRPSARSIRQCARLDLSHNLFEQIPETMAHVYALDTIDLSYNNIKEVAKASLCLGNITCINLSHNQLQSIVGLEKLWSLRSLDISHNFIESIEEVFLLKDLPDLEDLKIAGNPFCQSSSHGVRSRIFGVFGDRSRNLSLDGSPFSLIERLKNIKWLSTADYNNQTVSASSKRPEASASLSLVAESRPPDAASDPITARVTAEPIPIPSIEADSSLQVPRSQTLPATSAATRAAPTPPKNRGLAAIAENPGQSYKRRIESLKMEAGTNWIRVYQSMQQQQSSSSVDVRKTSGNPPLLQNSLFQKESDLFSGKDSAAGSSLESVEVVSQSLPVKSNSNPTVALRPLSRSKASVASTSLVKISVDIASAATSGADNTDTLSVISELSRNIHVPTVLGPFAFCVAYSFIDPTRRQNSKPTVRKRKVIVNPDYLYEMPYVVGDDDTDSFLPSNAITKWSLQRLICAKIIRHKPSSRLTSVRCEFRAGPTSLDVVELSSDNTYDRRVDEALNKLAVFLRSIVANNSILSKSTSLAAGKSSPNSPAMPRSPFEWKCMDCSRSFQAATRTLPSDSKSQKCSNCGSLFTVRLRIDGVISTPTTPLALSPPISPLLMSRQRDNQSIGISSPSLKFSSDINAPIESWETMVWFTDGLLLSSENDAVTHFIHARIALISSRKICCWPHQSDSAEHPSRQKKRRISIPITSITRVKIGPFKQSLTIFYEQSLGDDPSIITPRMKFLLHDRHSCMDFIERLSAWFQSSSHASGPRLIDGLDEICSRWWLESIREQIWLSTVTTNAINAAHSLPHITEQSVKLYLNAELLPPSLPTTPQQSTMIDSDSDKWGLSDWFRRKWTGSPSEPAAAKTTGTFCSLLVIEDFVFIAEESHHLYPSISDDQAPACIFRLLAAGMPIRKIERLTRASLNQLSKKTSNDYGICLVFIGGGAEWKIRLFTAESEEDACCVLNSL